MSGRLPAHLEASGLRRAAEAAGGNAMVLARGDADRGALLLVLLEQGAPLSVIERQLSLNGEYRWNRVESAPVSDPQALDGWLSKRRRGDPDIWLIELDVPRAERFIVENGLSG